MNINDMSAEDILSAGAVDARIDELGWSLTEFEDEDNTREERQAEFDALVRFRDEVSGQVRWNPEHMTFIRESYFKKYAEEKARDIYGEATETDYWKTREWASDMHQEFWEIELNDVTYLYDGH